MELPAPVVGEHPEEWAQFLRSDEARARHDRWLLVRMVGWWVLSIGAVVGVTWWLVLAAQEVV